MAEKVSQFSINPSDTKAMMDLAAQYKGKSTSQGETVSGVISGQSNQSLLRTQVNGFSGRVVGNGKVEDLSGTQRGSASLVKDGTLQFPNGMIVREDVAIQNGWARREVNGSLTLLDSDFAVDQKPTLQRHAQQTSSTPEEAGENAMNEAFAKTDAILDNLEASVSAQDREALMDKAISGNADYCQAALGNENLDALVKGYTLWAENITKDMQIPGAVSIAEETLNDEELQALRSAILRGDQHGTRHMIAQALKGLESVDRAEGLLTELEAQGARVERRADGSAKITLPNGVSGSLGSLLRSRHIRFE